MIDQPEAIPCGCTGKTPLSRVVHPARDRVRACLARAGVHLSGHLDCGIFPRRTHLGRSLRTVTIRDGRVETSGTASSPSDGRSTESERAWGLTAVLAAPTIGTSVEAFAGALATGYTALQVTDRFVVGKGHSIQVADTDQTSITAEVLVPRGTRRPGYVLGNVDVVHAFPGLDPATQAAIAAAHALNDCYAYGGTAVRTVRPVVGVPRGVDPPGDSTVRTWFRDGLPTDIALLSPQIVDHGGEGWLVGTYAMTR